jgi:hypothetical protein
MKLFKRKNLTARLLDPYDRDGLRSIHNHDFMEEKWFKAAYKRGIKAAGEDYSWQWRVYIGLWVAQQAARLNGDFVECGVHLGFLSSSIMRHLDWNSLDKKFYLFDTFYGLDEKQLCKDEITLGIGKGYHHKYQDCYKEVVENFSEYKRVHIIQGVVPDSLKTVKIDNIAYLAIDMNNAKPEKAAIEFFWDKIVPGGFILFDDYAYLNCQPQKVALDTFAKEHQIEILSLPTGQGLIIKPSKIS